MNEKKEEEWHADDTDLADYRRFFVCSIFKADISLIYKMLVILIEVKSPSSSRVLGMGFRVLAVIPDLIRNPSSTNFEFEF